jgi:hypothetical protein
VHWNYTRGQRVEDLLERAEIEWTPAMFARPKGAKAVVWNKVITEVRRKQAARDG